EFIGKQATLAKWMDISASTLSRLLKRMNYLGLVSLQHVIGGSRICLTGYDEFTFVPTEPETGGKEKTDVPKSSAAAQMAEAEAKMGGRSMQDSTNLPN
ncbi:MarR family transcriptional regulator, partial [Parabacteroides sp. AF18-52]